MSTDADVLLEAQGLSRRLSDQAQVQDVSLTLRRGDVLGLLGLNGAGKSTTLRLLCGVLAADSGDVLIGGHSFADEPCWPVLVLVSLPDLPPLVSGYASDRVSKLVCTPAPR